MILSITTLSHYAECCGLFIIMLNIIMLSVVLNVVMLNVVILSVVALLKGNNPLTIFIWLLMIAANGNDRLCAPLGYALALLANI